MTIALYGMLPEVSAWRTVKSISPTAMRRARMSFFMGVAFWGLEEISVDISPAPKFAKKKERSDTKKMTNCANTLMNCAIWHSRSFQIHL
jgi:hypothetical protein